MLRLHQQKKNAIIVNQIDQNAIRSIAAAVMLTPIQTVTASTIALIFAQ